MNEHNFETQKFLHHLKIIKYLLNLHIFYIFLHAFVNCHLHTSAINQMMIGCILMHWLIILNLHCIIFMYFLYLHFHFHLLHCLWLFASLLLLLLLFFWHFRCLFLCCFVFLLWFSLFLWWFCSHFLCLFF